MKNHIFPCNECYPHECHEFCIRYKKYFSALIKSYAKHGNRSLLWKYAKTQLSYKFRLRIQKAVDMHFNIGLKHKKSGKGIAINRKGTIMRFKEDEVVSYLPYKPFRDLYSYHKKQRK